MSHQLKVDNDSLEIMPSIHVIKRLSISLNPLAFFVRFQSIVRSNSLYSLKKDWKKFTVLEHAEDSSATGGQLDVRQTLIPRFNVTDFTYFEQEDIT